ncbi:aftiphilin isoform X1 [Vombatus ursinus]|uniref:Aftiphilin n=1 Tax=Vombatus ursinus TaxID=29139 RepID=A0A4X2L4S3_VOMUR|nr:aftiphilin isoform X1 [Vombatus ursinus]XP_027721038.1 aftiphilin isoform X1 [Vombatus ursinus]XP_027721039.1 aftiphilin isoform X1 [Vombatus ursinus]
MEPDIIRMYSSSPPPLDNGADDDDEDEFGEFGGFSEVSPSGVGFVDFDAPEFTNSKEEFIPSNHFMPIHGFSENVDSFTSFKPIKNGNGKDSIAELPSLLKEQSDVLSSTTSKEIIQSRTSDTLIDNIGSPGDLNEVVGQRENVGTSESFPSDSFRIDMKIVSHDKQVDSCNGEILTNGFAALDTVNPQGKENLDITDSKRLKSHSTQLHVDSTPSPTEEFADFATFSKKERVQLEEIRCEVLNVREALTIQENNKINKIHEGSSVKQVSLDRSCENEEKTLGQENQVCISEISVVTNEKYDPSTLEQIESNTSTQTALNSVDTTDNAETLSRREQCEADEKLDFLTFKCATLCMDSIKTSETNDISYHPKEETVKFTNIQSTSIDLTEENVFDESTDLKNGDSSNDFVSCSDTNEDDFGDFGTVSGATPPFVSGTQDSMSDITFEESSEQFLHFSEPGDDFDFGDTDAATCQEEITYSQLELKQTSDSLSEGYEVARKSSVSGIEPPSKLKNGGHSQFESLGPEIQDECSAFQDPDDFADFSSADPNQAADWNAFEDEQKESCSWAAFGDEQTVESPLRKEACQSHRTDESIVSPLTQKTHTVPLPPSQGAAASDHSHESASSIQIALLNRLERIFEACFPSLPVPETEEGVTSLEHLLEASNTQIRTREALGENWELLDVWTELQDIHDAYGLRYQWGGSHSNKKLLCSLGIDTRNILFTGNKKQPVIVPMYAAGLGMLEPTKEPLKPLSAAEKIASIGQTPLISPEMSACTSDQLQESLPPVQFDWSSSGLTNPLDASGGSTLLNLDFFGPVDDSSSSSTTTIPGVDPELYELTTSKLETANSSIKVTDAFARLMSTVEKTSTSTRKPKREERLSEEAAKVIASLPDLTFMHAKVLMFPATLTPSTSCHEKAD